MHSAMVKRAIERAARQIEDALAALAGTSGNRPERRPTDSPTSEPAPRPSFLEYLLQERRTTGVPEE